jgi:small-conductance mechanosensitive channel
MSISLISAAIIHVYAQAEIKIPAVRDSIGVKYPIIFFEDTVGYLSSAIGAFTAEERAERINGRLSDLLNTDKFDTATLGIQLEDQNAIIIHNKEILGIITATDTHTEADSLDQSQIAVTLISNLKKSYLANYASTTYLANLIRAGMLLGILIGLFLLVRLLNLGFNRLIEWILNRWQDYFLGIRIKNYQFLTKEKQESLLRMIMSAIKIGLIILLLYLSLPLIFSIFPATKGLAGLLLSYITDPLWSIFNGLIGYLPELFMILVISVVTYYVTKFFSFISREIERGVITIPGFYPDWAKPTFNLLKVILIAFAFIVIFPYLPGSESPAFQGVSVFLGLLISLGSSSAISNIIAGLVIIYMRAFRKGDRVKIGDITGDVIEKTMLVTRIRTIKNEEVTIPNASILNGNTVNYTNAGTSSGLILHTTITIGYDIPWRQVHELLITSAVTCDMILKDPKPYVLQTSLDDFYVSYQINVFTKNPEKSALIYSNLHAAIQDAFTNAKVEIMSPHYRAERDGNTLTIPPTYLSKDKP